MPSRKITGLSDEQFRSIYEERRVKRMAHLDALPADIRALVHDYGSTVVNACLDCGVQKANYIRHLVETVLNEFSPTRGAYSSQGARSALGIEDPAP